MKHEWPKQVQHAGRHIEFNTDQKLGFEGYI